MTQLIYKICPRPLWEAAVAQGEFRGAPVDLQDGFIHFSAAHQVSATADKHFAGQQDLLLVAVDADSLGDKLKWEVSRGGDLFPHLYGPLPTSNITSVQPIPTDNNGKHLLPITN
jgi:uncharacterized protein (DUF952 family)